MSYLKVIFHVKKFDTLNLVEKVKIQNTDEFYFFKPQDQFQCLHLKVLCNLKEFKKYLTINKNIFYPLHNDYYDVNTNCLKFKDYQLLNEQQYKC